MSRVGLQLFHPDSPKPSDRPVPAKFFLREDTNEDEEEEDEEDGEEENESDRRDDADDDGYSE